MKKFFLILVLLFSFFINSFNTYSVYAESLYMRVITESTPFYCNPADNQPLFYLPYTYYVKVIGYENGLSHVECYGINSIKIDGYVPTDLLYDDDLEVVSPYPEIKICTLAPSIIYQDCSLLTPIQYVFPSRELDYYGILPTDNGNLYYVGYNGKLGYIKETEIQPFVLENHPNELTFLQTDATIPPNDDQENENQEQNPPSNSTLKIIIVVCLSLAGLVGFFVASKNLSHKNSSDTSYYDDNDYE